MKNFSIKIFIALLALAGVITVASAQLVPPSTPPGGNVFPPINISGTDQVKQGGITAQFFAGKKGLFREGACSNFSCLFFVPNLFEALKFNSAETDYKGIRIDSNGDFFIRDGNQAASKVLTSDASGKATWQTSRQGGLSCSLDANPAQVTSFPQSIIISWRVFGQGGININNGVGSLTGTYNSASDTTSGTRTVTITQSTTFSGAATNTPVVQDGCRITVLGPELPSGTNRGDILFWNTIVSNDPKWAVNTAVKADITTGSKGWLATDLLDVKEGACPIGSTTCNKVATNSNQGIFGRVVWKDTIPVYKITNERCENYNGLSTSSSCLTKICGTYTGTNATYSGKSLYPECDAPIGYCANNASSAVILSGSIAPYACNNQLIGRMITQ